VDAQEVIAEARHVSERAWSRLFAARPELEKPAGFAVRPGS
jgi:hypothetical protein